MQPAADILFYLLWFILGGLVFLSMVLMSDLGQWLNVPRRWVVWHYERNGLLIGCLLVLLVVLWLLHLLSGVGSFLWMGFGTVAVIVLVYLANCSVRLLFPSKYDAQTSTDNYVTVDEADKTLADDAIIYAVGVDGDAVGFPRDELFIPHIAGARVGDADVAMVYCGLSNLPMVFNRHLSPQRLSELRAHIQVHNNLIIRDHQSGALIQQVTGEVLSGKAEVGVLPNTIMTWHTFRETCPGARVFRYDYAGPLDGLTRRLIPWMIGNQFSPEHGPAFPTLDLADDRLPRKEWVWGFRYGGTVIAITRDFARANTVYPFEAESRPFVMVYDVAHDILAVYERELNGEPVDTAGIDWRGGTAKGRLRQFPLHNGVLWMVWSHWFPQTQVWDVAGI